MHLRCKKVVLPFHILCCSLSTVLWTNLIITLLCLIVSFRSSILGRRSSSCVCSKVALLNEMVVFLTSLTRWFDCPWLFVISVVCLVCIGFVGRFFIGVRVCLTTVFVNGVARTVCLIFVWVFLSFQLTALILAVTWLFQAGTCWFGFSWILLCGLLRPSSYLQFIWSLECTQCCFPSKMWHNLFICVFSKCARLINFFSLGGFSACMKCSMIAWAATLNASFASFWSSSRKAIHFWFAGLKTSRWNLCFDLAFDWGFTYFLRNTVKIPPKFSLLRLLMFLNVWRASQRMRKTWFFLSSSVSWLWIFRLVWNRSSNSSSISEFPSKMGIVVVRGLGSFEILLIL